MLVQEVGAVNDGVTMTAMASAAVESEHFLAWDRYFGLLAEIHDRSDDSRVLTTRIHGFENTTDPDRSSGSVEDLGTSYGYVVEGRARLEGSDVSPTASVVAGMWFALPHGFAFELAPGSRMVVCQTLGYRGTRSLGGPIEPKGRLRYIDGCSDTLLAAPSLVGDPCLNHLHFPEGISQSEHYHPTVRAGAIARGSGWCDTPYGRTALREGLVFCIPALGRHRFVTDESELDVIAYHPDSDWGPTDLDHPMINRTWVGEGKIDNSAGPHAQAEVVGR